MIKYDAEIAILVSESPGFIDRLDILFKYGLVNCNKHKILIKLIKKNGHHSKDYLIEKYKTENIDLKNIFFDTDEPAQKRFSYYINLNEDDINQARWFIFIDDDTITDIDGTISKLDDFFDWNENAYASGELMNNHQHEEWEIANLMNKTEWYKGGKGPYHEWEICCLSQAALRKILNNAQAKRVLTLRSKFSKGWGDHCMGLAAKFAKIYPVSTDFLSANPLILESTFLNGWVTHFHRIYSHKAIKAILPIMFNRTDGNFANSKILLTIKNKTIENRIFIKLNAGGCVSEGNKRIAMWVADQEKLKIYTLENEHPFVFDFVDGNSSQVEDNIWTININE